MGACDEYRRCLLTIPGPRKRFAIHGDVTGREGGNSMNERDGRRALAAATATIGVVAFAVVMTFPQLAKLNDGGCALPGDAMIRFELARSLTVLPWLSGCAGAAKAMDAENHLDVAAFIWSYNGFIALAAVFLARRLRRALVLAAIAAAAIALIADYVETFTLLKITRSLADSGPLFPISSTAAWTKFAFIGVNAALLSAICWTAWPGRPILGALLLLPVMATVVLAVDIGRSVWLTYAYMASWLPVMLVAVKEAIVPPRPA
jgi:hypothetical protein